MCFINERETRSVVGQLAEVVAEYPFVEVAEEIERFDSNIGAFQAMLEKRPEAFHAVRVNLPMDVLLGTRFGIPLCARTRASLNAIAPLTQF